MGPRVCFATCVPRLDYVGRVQGNRPEEACCSDQTAFKLAVPSRRIVEGESKAFGVCAQTVSQHDASQFCGVGHASNHIALCLLSQPTEDDQVQATAILVSLVRIRTFWFIAWSEVFSMCSAGCLLLLFAHVLIILLCVSLSPAFAVCVNLCSIVCCFACVLVCCRERKLSFWYSPTWSFV